MNRNEKLAPQDVRSTVDDVPQAIPDPGPIPFSGPEDHEKVRLRRTHAWRASGRDAATVPSEDDHEALCPHGNAFNVCVGCMTGAGLSGGEILKRRARATNAAHGAPVMAETPPVVVPPRSQEDISRDIARRTGEAVRKAQGR